MTTALQTPDLDTLTLPASASLEADNSQYTNRIRFTSASGSEYLIAQRKFNPKTGKGGWWACDCPSYMYGRKGAKICKHMKDFGLPGNYEPFFVGQLVAGTSTKAIGANTLRDKDRKAAANKLSKKNRPALRAVDGGTVDGGTKAAAPAPAKAAPAALASGPKPVSVNMSKDGKIVVEWDAADAQAVFALLATLG